MDKRYFLMLIIIVVCFINLFLIVNHSDVVGSANVECGQYICSIPYGFSLYESKSDEITLVDSNRNSSIFIDSQLRNNDNVSARQNRLLNDNKTYIILGNGTIDVNGITIDSIYYTNVNHTQNYSVFYFDKFNNSFKILITGFDYDTERNYPIDLLTEIITSLKINHRI